MTSPDINKILRNDPVSCRRGAPLGQLNFHVAASPLYLQQIRLIDGAYSADGTYWGSGTLWCAFNGDDTDFAAGCGTRIYVRAEDREDAKRAVLSLYPGTTFRR